MTKEEQEALAQEMLAHEVRRDAKSQELVEEDERRKEWPDCSDGTRKHDMQGQPVCPTCGFEPPIFKASKGTVGLPGHARERAEGSR